MEEPIQNLRTTTSEPCRRSGKTALKVETSQLRLIKKISFASIVFATVFFVLLSKPGIISSNKNDDNISIFLRRRTQELSRDSFYDKVDDFYSQHNNTNESQIEGNATVHDLQWCQTEYSENELVPSENAWILAIPSWLQYTIMVVLLVFSALFSGLTLGLMSLDCTGLTIVMEGEDEVNAEAARRIYKVRKDGNLLLCTLLLGNVLVNAFLSILMGELFGGIIALVGSTIMIVIWGEIVPQALCSRYALKIGSAVVPIVRVIMFLIYPCAFPMAYALNVFLGEELVTTYSSGEMRKLLQIHVQEGRFDKETGQAMTGALKYKDISVKDVMTPSEKTFMLDVDEKLDFRTIAKIFKTGYSRIPIYEINPSNIIGMLFVKDLIFIDPEDETPLRSFVQIFGRGVHVVWPDDKLGDVLRELKKGKSHMALVRDVNNETEGDPVYEIKGIITLEDIIEEILGEEIVDETDAFVDSTQRQKVNRKINGDDEEFDWGRLRLLDAKIVEQYLSEEEAKAVTAHLRINYSSVFSLLSDNQLYRLVSETPVEELCVKDQLYQEGVETDVCTLILGGKVTVLAGVDKFRSDLSSWSVLGGAALLASSYQPDFSASVTGAGRCLRFTKTCVYAAIDTSAVERQSVKKTTVIPIMATHRLLEVPSTATDGAAHADTATRHEATMKKRNKFIAALRQKTSKKKKNQSDEEASSLSSSSIVEKEEAAETNRSISFAPGRGSIRITSNRPSSLLIEDVEANPNTTRNKGYNENK